MQIKLSDYILEQSISDQEVSNILLEQAIAEANVAFSLCDAYLKQCMIEEMLGIEDEDIEDEVVTESDTDTETETEDVTTESFEDDITIEDGEEIVTEAAKSKKKKEESEPKAEETSSEPKEEPEPKEEKPKTQTKTYGATNPTKEKASDYQEKEPKVKEPKEKGRVMRAIKATFKAIGKFMHVIAVKLGMVNDRIIKNNKRLIHLVNDSSTEEIQELADYLKKKLHFKNDRELYRYYNPSVCRKVLVTLNQATQRFNSFVEEFCKIGTKKSLDGTKSKKDEDNQRSIGFVNRGLTEFVDALYTLDSETSFDIGSLYDPNASTYRFQDRIRDYIRFWDLTETKGLVGGITGAMNSISHNIHQLDIKWNYTMNYRGDIFSDIARYKEMRDKIVYPPHATDDQKKAIKKAFKKAAYEKMWKTDILKDRSYAKQGERDEFVQIRSTIHEINAVMNGGGKRSIASRIGDMNERYFAVYDFYNNKVLKEREEKQKQKEAS